MKMPWWEPRAFAKMTTKDGYHPVIAALGFPMSKSRVKNATAILAALQAEGILSCNTAIGALATAVVESALRPIPEYPPSRTVPAGTAYEGRADLGNIHPGDGPRYKGRGFIQITGRANYRIYGRRLGIDLEGDPELALVPEHAASILAAFFRDRGIHECCHVGNWRAVRKRVNGGYNGWKPFKDLVDKLYAGSPGFDSWAGGK